MNEPELMARMVRGARLMLADAVKPRDDTERAIVDALGECSWDECVTAIQRYRAEQVPTGGSDG
jgi:hypothetical protein